MFKHILMPTDGSDHSKKAIERGIELARLCGARVTGIHVVPDCRMMVSYDGSLDSLAREQVEKEAGEQAVRFMSFVQHAASASNVPCDTVVVANAHPYDAIVDTANQRGCDLIVMTARSRKGLVSMVMRNESSRVLHRASIPVLVFRGLMSADHPDKMAAKKGKG